MGTLMHKGCQNVVPVALKNIGIGTPWEKTEKKSDISSKIKTIYMECGDRY